MSATPKGKKPSPVSFLLWNTAERGGDVKARWGGEEKGRKILIILGTIFGFLSDRFPFRLFAHFIVLVFAFLILLGLVFGFLALCARGIIKRASGSWGLVRNIHR